ncbi:MAG: hypothetical protein KGH66_00900 [Candidatus Micrarchaeota archaeon]|nr:hypothetical protein [Candidatus Micrarchaeota archaeon]
MAGDKAYYAFPFALLAVALMLMVPNVSHAANATNATTLQFQSTGTGPCVIPKAAKGDTCSYSSIIGLQVAGHTVSCGYVQECPGTCGTGGPTDSATASSAVGTGSIQGGGSYSSGEINYCNGGYDNYYSITLPSGSSARYECQDGPQQATSGTGSSAYSNYYDAGSCDIVDYNTTTTNYPYALNGIITSGGSSPVTATPAISNVLNDNTANALWLLSCPQSPGTSTAEYFDSNPASYIGGDTCQTYDVPLTSGAKVTTMITWNAFAPLSGNIVNLTFTNLAAGSISDIAYSGATNSIGSPTFQISNGYNTNSYIFQQVPSGPQKGVWSWQASRANVVGFSPALLSQWQGYSSLSYTGGNQFSYIQPLTETVDGTTYQWTCQDTYSFSFGSPSGGGTYTIDSIQNANIPLPDGEQASVVPYMLYNITLPSLASDVNYNPSNAVMALSLDTYSPHNLGTPSQSLDPFPFYSDSGFFGGQSGASGSYLGVFSPDLMSVAAPQTKALGNPSPTILSALTTGAASALGFDPKLATIGVYADGELPNPTYISASPNDFVYVLNYTSTCSFLCFSSATSSNLYVMRFVPKGDYNLSNYQPGSVPFTFSGDDPSALTTWSKEWGSYWANSLLQQGQDLYITNVYPVSSTSSAFWGAYSTSTGLGSSSSSSSSSSSGGPSISVTPRSTVGASAGQQVQFQISIIDSNPVPYYVTITDSQGNFASVPIQSGNTGVYTYTVPAGASGSDALTFKLGDTKGGAASTTASIDVGPSTIIPTAIASDYNNDLFIMGANEVTGSNTFEVGVIWGNGVIQPPVTVNTPINFIASDELAASPGGQYLYIANATTITPGSNGVINIYQTSNFNAIGNIPLAFSTADYSMNVVAYLAAGGPYSDPAVAAAYQGSGEVLDQPSNHHPIAITDSGGIIYVLDNWTIDVGGMHSSELLLRAFSYNGVELPVGYSTINTIVQGAQYIQSPNIAGGQMPPYGWPLSVNISVGSGSPVSYCAADCTFSPTSASLASSQYPPIGPMIKATGVVGPTANDLGFTSDFNGTSYLVAHVYQAQQTNALSGIYNFLFGSSPTPVYSELVVFRPTLTNYTRQSLAADSPYVCYTDKDFGSASPCVYDSSAAPTLTGMYPPVMGVPSSFYYLESKGSPQQYLSLQNVASSLLPTGLNCQATSGGLEECQQAASAAASINSQQIATALSGSEAGAATAVSTQPNTYVNSIISGYVLIPYKITYDLGEGASNPKAALVAGTEPPYGSPSPADYEQVCPRRGGGPCTEVPICASPSSPLNAPATGHIVQYAYGRVNLPSSDSLNNTIEGGGTYVQFQPANNYYIANVSDAGMITLPRTDMNIFTNRLFGEAYINRTISPGSLDPNGYTSPMVINAVRQNGYQENYFIQSAKSGATYPGYSLQQSQPADPTELQILGASCGSSCPSTYYYSTDPSAIYQGSSSLLFAPLSQVNYLQLFDIFQRASNLYYLGFATPENSFLGYNRLIYTLVDRFNNVVFMPLSVDFANQGQITLTPTVTVNALNANETKIDITGLATYTNSVGTFPLPAGSDVYLYYDTNLNYFSSTLFPNPLSGSASDPYYQYALQCAFSSTGGSCPLANPLSTITQGTSAATLADFVSFKTNYGATPNECAPEPQSLLTVPAANQCNIYGAGGLPSSVFDPNINGYQYCDPTSPNGDGVLTSQMGLMSIVQTDANGGFSYTFNVCGTGSHQVVASYYGSPGPEPFYVTQTPLTQSAGQYEFFSAGNTNGATAQKTLEYGYTFSPNVIASDVQVGSYALGFGSVGLLSLVAMVALIFAALAVRGRIPQKRKRKTAKRSARKKR